jgi:cell wall-associated NlpC family hydrolase
MRLTMLLGAVFVASALTGPVATAAQPPDTAPESPTERQPELQAGTARSAGGVQKAIDDALRLVGIRYRSGGNDAETGFDCSGFVGYVFRTALGLMLPRTARDISRTGEPVAKAELEPGDLVFFHTMRHAFSHVGIYLGENRFVHSPRPGEAVRIEDMRERYWAKRYNGARRVESR